MTKSTSWTVAAAVVLAAAAPPAAAQENDRLVIDLSVPALRVTVRAGDTVLKTYPVAVGQVGHETPLGTYTISHAEWNPWWRPPASAWARGSKPTPPGSDNPMGGVKLYFAPLYYRHGTPDEESLGTPASHGCVRMLNDDMVELATLLHDRARPTLAPEQIPGVLARSGQTRVSRFGDSVTFVVRYETVEVLQGELVIYPDIYGRRATHAEAVYQALLKAGYPDVRIDRPRVQEILSRARSSGRTTRLPLTRLFAQATRVRELHDSTENR
ncbi:MAG TPA: L,D-transpeptidase [Longimicrobium sp.]